MGMDGGGLMRGGGGVGSKGIGGNERERHSTNTF